MNKLSKEQIELATEEMISFANFDEARSLTMEEIDQLVRDARRAQAQVAGQMIKTAFKFVGKIFAGIGNGLHAATTYDELARLSDRELADIGLNRDQIASVAFDDLAIRSAKSSFTVYGGGMKITRPTNDWVDHIAA
ncbi:MAG: DUF1127 domain-containing protein [Rhodospirillales bacterium]|nr:DUF1127 domain-containing protein [Rhodospirillales bacterium]